METISLPTLPLRKADSHKGDYGKVLVIAGSETMIGAPAIVGLAALRTGSGLVRIATSKDILPHVLTICPYATGFAWTSTRIKELLTFAEEHDALAVGPGLGQSPSTKRLVLELLERHRGPMVLDADALNALSLLDPSEWPKRRDWSNVVLTPHMGEFMRLMNAVMKRGGTIAAAAADPQSVSTPPSPGAPKRARSLADDDDAPSTADGVVLEIAPEENPAAEVAPTAAPAAPSEPSHTSLAELLARSTGAVVVLKGHRTVITDGHRFAVNTTGNPAMATAGSGDVLTGVIASLIGQKFSALDAAVLGAHLHGMAGDLAVAAIGPAGILATDVATHLPQALARRLKA
jgi:ADP-dependent NAD(P)H-hydrate dehydratase